MICVMDIKLLWYHLFIRLVNTLCFTYIIISLEYRIIGKTSSYKDVDRLGENGPGVK